MSDLTQGSTAEPDASRQPLPLAMQHTAARRVATAAVNSDEARYFLDMLGLDPTVGVR